MNLYQVELKICGTAYIKAESEKEAMEIAKKLNMDCLELTPQDGEVPISGLDFKNPSLPGVSLSPAMTIHGPWDEKTTADLAEADIDDEGDDEDR
jgi:hypothetical protein